MLSGRKMVVWVLFSSLIFLSTVVAVAPGADSDEKRHREDLERGAVVVPEAPSPSSPEAKLPSTRTGATEVSLSSAINWDAAFQSAGDPSQDLRLALVAPSPRFRFWSSCPLYIGLENLRAERRVFAELPTLDSLHSAEGVFFRIRSGGSEVVLSKGYAASDSKREYKPLVIEGGSRLYDLADFSNVVAGSGEVFDLVSKGFEATIRVEIPALGLVSNEIALTFDH